MSNEETGKLIDLIAYRIFFGADEVVTLADADALALRIVGELRGLYRIELENTVEEEKS